MTNVLNTPAPSRGFDHVRVEQVSGGPLVWGGHSPGESSGAPGPARWSEVASDRSNLLFPMVAKTGTWAFQFCFSLSGGLIN